MSCAIEHSLAQRVPALRASSGHWRFSVARPGVMICVSMILPVSFDTVLELIRLRIIGRAKAAV
eukprot:8287604-Pyramimonas_sp.AAC.1